MDWPRFRALLRRMAPDGASVDGLAAQAFDTLENYYRDPGRHYHGPRHIEYCLRQLDLARSRIVDPDAVELALWFHDAVYDLKGGDNEARSARLCIGELGTVLPAARLSRVHSLIMVTAPGHEPANEDEAYMHDIDLSVFARPWDEFREDSEAVRREKAHLGEAEFVRRQDAFLRSLLAGDSIYYTDFFRERCEQRARENITRWLEVLAQRVAADA